MNTLNDNLRPSLSEPDPTPTFTLTISCGNAAFSENLHWELARVLHEVGYRIQDRQLTEGLIRDANGNTVGEFKLNAP